MKFKKINEILKRHHNFNENIWDSDSYLGLKYDGGYGRTEAERMSTNGEYGAPYNPYAEPGKDWFKMYDTVKRNGGDGFYGGLSIPYEEPVMLKYNYIKDECPNAEMVQPKMMQFKCNYRDLNKAKSKIDILKKSLSY